MSTTEKKHPQLQALDASIARLRDEVRVQTDKAKTIAHAKLAQLRAERDSKRLEILTGISTSIIKAQVELAAGEAKAKGEAHRQQLEHKLQQAKRDLQDYAMNVKLATDEEIESLEAYAKTAGAAAKDRIAQSRDRLRAQRDAFTRSAEAFARAGGAKVELAKQEFELSMRELTNLSNEGAVLLN
jgi:hypothetical protein